MSEPTQGYIMLDPDQVEVFLLAHPGLVDFLQELPTQLAPYFPFPGTQLSLQGQYAAERLQPQDRLLFVGVHTTLPPDEAYRKLEEFDQAWWLEHEPEWLEIDVDFTRIEEVLRDSTGL